MAKGHAKRASVRIISGQWRGRRLDVLEQEGLRPTKDAVRETVFNWLGADLYGVNALDLFSGTGAMGLECASRYAQNVVLVEKAPAVARHLVQLVQNLPQSQAVQVCTQDALAYLNTQEIADVDVIFIDPPFSLVDVNDVLSALFAKSLKPNVQIYIEQDAKQGLPALPQGWVYDRQKRSGQVVYGLVCRD